MGKASKGIAGRLRAAMLRKGSTQAEVAKVINASGGAVSQWLAGTKLPSRDNIRGLSAFLELDPEWLEFGSGSGPQPDADKERTEYLRTNGWAMRPAHPDGGRDYGNSNVEAFNPDVATMVREAIQNVGDQRIEPSVKVVFRVIRLKGKDLVEFKKAAGWDLLSGHLGAAAQVPQRHGRLIRAGLEEIERSRELLLLVAEDSGTTGLVGEEQGTGNFAALARNNLDSSKTSPTAGGSKGLGKGTWWRASTVFTVFLNSDLSQATADGRRDVRIIGRCELPWHTDTDGKSWAGPGWYGVVRKQDGIDIAESVWANRTLAHDLFIDRASDLGPGTTICVVGFQDPSSDELKDARTLAEDIEAAVVDNFWPAMVDGRLAVRIETWEGRTNKTSVEVDAGTKAPALADGYQKFRAENVREALAMPGDVVRRTLTLSVPARIASEGRHDALRHEAALVVRRAEEDGPTPRVNSLAVLRGPRMIVEYRPLRSAFPGAMPFHAMLVCGEAVRERPNADDTRADRFLRASEPPAHDRWTVTPELRTEYSRGFKKAIDDLFEAALREIGDLVRPRGDDLDDGPNALKELLNIGDDTPPPLDKPRIYKPSAAIDGEGRWVIDARIRVRPEPGVFWRVHPVVLFDMESGGGQPVAWKELEPMIGCTLENGQLVLSAGVNEARFRGVTDPTTHPVASSESAIRVDLRKAVSTREVEP